MKTSRSDARDWNRRLFLASTGAAGLMGMLPADAADAKDQPKADQPKADRVVEGKDARLFVHSAGVASLETPPELLDQRITPLNLLFVRNNQQPENAATLKPLPLKRWKIEFRGLIDAPFVLDAEELSKLPQVEHEMVLQCCGNGRSLYAGSVKAKGTQWTRGAMGNLTVKGARLSDILKSKGSRVDPRARFLSAEGKDEALPDKEDFEHSLPLADALSRSLLATHFNGSPIPAVHGGPVRLMTPGYYGTMHMKWLSRLRFEANESENHNHIPRYRTPRRLIQPGSNITYTLGNSKASWRMKLKSVLLSPQPGAKLEAGKRFAARGVAFNDGAARIDAVLVSANGGRSWRAARLQSPDSLFAWTRWSISLNMPKGEHEIWVRAVDALGRSQPIDGSIHWNPSGYEWNGVEKIKVTAV